jgi:hypothetical protein
MFWHSVVEVLALQLVLHLNNCMRNSLLIDLEKLDNREVNYR